MPLKISSEGMRAQESKTGKKLSCLALQQNLILTFGEAYIGEIAPQPVHAPAEYQIKLSTGTESG